MTPTHPDGALAPAVHALHDAVAALCAPQPHQHRPGRILWLDPRYQQLSDAMNGQSISGHGHTRAASLIPAQIDCLELKLRIDVRTAAISAQWRVSAKLDTPSRLQALAEQSWRPQDAHQLEQIATEIRSWVKAIDDLFAARIIYLPDRCPQCDHSHAYRWQNDGQHVRTPALIITADWVAACQQCHATWPPLFLARRLGYTVEGISA